MTAATELTPIRTSIEVDIPSDEAFAYFTERLGEWWPVGRHSIGCEKVARVIVEPRRGGRIYEEWHDGTRYDWARFTAWDPPHRFVMDWRPNPQPGPCTEVEVRFSAVAGRTLVELIHRGWDRLGETASEARRSYEEGWPFVLSHLGRK